MDHGFGIAADSSGNVLVTGRTESAGWVLGGWDTSFNGDDTDAYVTKLSPGGGHLWSSYIGGSDEDHGKGIAADSSGDVLVTGYTTSAGWVSGGWDTTYNGWDGFVTKLSSGGDHLWSSYLGGDGYDGGLGIAVDSSDNVLVTGHTNSTGWVSGGWDTNYNNGDDAFVAKLSPGGGHLWSSYLGGSDDDYGYDIAADSFGNLLVTGYTESEGWVSGGWDTTYDGYSNAFVAKIINTDAVHIDALSAAIRQGDQDAWFDVNADGTVDPLDRDYLVHNILGTEYGDANRDQKVSLADLTILATNYGVASDSTWSQGDFNGDGLVSSADLTILATNYGFDSAVIPPPSPAPVMATLAVQPQPIAAAITEPVETATVEPVAPVIVAPETTSPGRPSAMAAYWQSQHSQRNSPQRPTLRLLNPRPTNQWLSDAPADDEIDLLGTSRLVVV